MLSDDYLYITESSDLKSEEFYGYCAKDETIFHYKHNIPSIAELLSTYQSNSGVFLAAYQSDDKVIVFTDPLSQYPVFYWCSGDKFCVSNNFYSVAEYSGNPVDDSVISDYLTYMSPIGCKTIISDCFVLPAGYIIEICTSQHKRKFKLIPQQFDAPLIDYKSLLSHCAKRLESRAKGVLKLGSPTVHLTGGLDSRLSFAALLSASESASDFNVYCLGDGRRQDRLVFNYLVEKYSLNLGTFNMSGHKPATEAELIHTQSVFNGLKVCNQINFNGDFNPDKVEVTGYFSGGLLKEFGSYENKGVFKPYSYAKKISSLPSSTFDAASFKIYQSAYLEPKASIFDASPLNLLYINNRSKAHFGMQSVVNNQRYVSVDLIYDPLLIHLFNLAPYSNEQKNKGVVIFDLIKEISSEELALFPLADKTLPLFGSYIDNPPPEPNCFVKHSFNHDLDCESLPVIKSPPSFNSKGSERIDDFFSYLRNEQFDCFFEQYPEYLSLRKNSNNLRTIEYQCLASVLGILTALGKITH
jgi:hypothetical protein